LRIMDVELTNLVGGVWHYCMHDEGTATGSDLLDDQITKPRLPRTRFLL
jgi:hypothetical protein